MRRHLAALAVIITGCSGGSSSDGAAVDAGHDVAPWRDAAPVDPTSLFDGLAPFADVASSSGLPELAGTCVVFDDFDGDARPDVFLASFFGVPQSVALYLNDGAGHFAARPLSPIAFDSKVPAPGWCAAGDIDGDGKLDVVLASFASLEAHVLRNLGGGAFSDVQTLSIDAPGAVGCSALALADLDADGWLDLVLAPYGLAPALDDSSCAPATEGFACVVSGDRCTSPPSVFRNTGKLPTPFAPPRSLTQAADCGPGNTNALSITDWNGDGIPDVFVSNDWGANHLYVSSGPLVFAEAPAFALKKYNSAMGAAFEDFDFDGRGDLYVADMGSDQFYLGDDGGALTGHAEDWGVAKPTRFHSGWAPLGEDFDSDGFPDVFVASAAFVTSYDDLALVGGRGLAPRLLQYDLLLRNQAGRGFSALGVAQSKIAEATPMFGATAVADFDGDGRLDILEAVGYPMRVQLLHNETARQHWLQVRLRGHAPNVDAIGATVTISVPGRPPWKRYVQRARGSNGSSWATLHFGLGASTKVDRLDVRWPDGTTQTLATPGVDASLVLTQP